MKAQNPRNGIPRAHVSSATVSDTNFPLPFHRKDLQLLTVEQVSAQLRASRAFIRMCVDAGCATRKGKLSAASVLRWLFEHYNQVRELAGFPTLASVEGIAAEVAARLKMGNAVITLLEFSESRASDPEEKWQLRVIRRGVERSLDRA
jgi:hypothetical protein